MYLTLYEISKITKCNRSSLKTIINYLNLHYIEIFDKSNKIRKIYSNDDLEKIKNFLNEHPYPKTFFSELTNIKKYGVRNQFQRKEVHDKGIIAANTEEAKQHRKETCLIKYNGECPTADKTVFEKAKTTRVQNNGHNIGQIVCHINLKKLNLDYIMTKIIIIENKQKKHVY